jgi:hypothetical protein
MILTSEGHLGLAPIETQENDIVCVLLGGDMPFILRPNGDHYTFVGETYVYGIMDGEVLDVAKARLVSLEMFMLV